MPMQKTYKRYASLGSFGVVGSTRSNILMVKNIPYLRKSENTVYCITAALENLIVWDVRRGEKVDIYYFAPRFVPKICQMIIQYFGLYYSHILFIYFKVLVLKGNEHEVTTIAKSDETSYIAVG